MTAGRQSRPFLVRLEQSAGVPLWSFPMFIIAATLLWARGYPTAAFKSGLFQVAMLPIMIALRALDTDSPRLWLNTTRMIEDLAIVFLCIIAALSYVLNGREWLSALDLTFTFLIPAALYFLIRRANFPDTLKRKLIATYIIFGIIPFAEGLVIFFREVGIPTFAELVVLRYDNIRLTKYMDILYGFTTNTASLLTFLIPLCVFYLIFGKPAKWVRWLTIVALALFGFHAVINLVRTLMLTLLLMGILLLLRFWSGKAVAALGLAIGAITAAMLIPGPTQEMSDRFFSALMLNSESDNSVYARIDSIHIGLRQMHDNWQFGVGPELSAYKNTWTAAHEFFVNQGAQLGVIGFALWVGLFGTWIFTFLDHFLVKRESGLNVILLSCPFFYACFAILSNAPTSMGLVNSWIGSVMFFLALGRSGRTYNNGSQMAKKREM